MEKKDNEGLSLGQLLAARSRVTPQEVDDMVNMSAEELRTFGDPPPGTDEAWDTLTESEKNYFRACRKNGGRDPMAGGKTLSQLMRDREAIEVEVREVKEE